MKDYIIIGVILLLIVGLTIIEQSEVKPETVLPSSLGNFKDIKRSEHIDPIFKGERYSVHAFFTPKAESEFSESIERLGISIYLFWNNNSCLKAKETLIESYGPEYKADQVRFNQAKTKIYYTPTQEQAETFWCKKKLLFQVLAVSNEENMDHKILKKAIISGARSVLKTYNKATSTR